VENEKQLGVMMWTKQMGLFNSKVSNSWRTRTP